MVVRLVCMNMLEDRSYMRSSGFRPSSLLSVTFILVFLHLIVFVAGELNKVYGRFPVLDYLALSKNGIANGYFWQLLSFQFLHSHFWHFIFNMLLLFMFGPSVEEALGKKHFAVLYLLTGVVGGLVEIALALTFPQVFVAPVVGASAGVCGLIAAFATLAPDREVLLMFVFPVRARHMLLGLMAVAAFYVVVPAAWPGIGHGAHLAGFIAGWAYIHWIIQARVSLRGWQQMRPVRPTRELVGVRFPKLARSSNPKQEPQPEPELAPSEFITREVDPILDKISAHGMQSLTPREKQVLEAARAKIAKKA